MFFSDWFTLLRIIVVGVGAYLALLILLRISGKRTLLKFNALDFIITVALGSTLSSVLVLSKQTALLDGALAFVLLIGMQFFW